MLMRASLSYMAVQLCVRALRCALRLLSCTYCEALYLNAPSLDACATAFCACAADTFQHVADVCAYAAKCILNWSTHQCYYYAAALIYSTVVGAAQTSLHLILCLDNRGCMHACCTAEAVAYAGQSYLTLA
jgi:hypothetical protein